MTALAAAVQIAVSAPARAGDGPEADTVARYLEAGGDVPGWAHAGGLGAALLEEARRHGVAGVADMSAVDGLKPEHTIEAALRFARVLARGAVAPATVQRDWTIPTPAFSLDELLRALVALEDPLPWLRRLGPQDAEYRELQQALESYEALMEPGGSSEIPASTVLKSGMSGDRVAALQARLRHSGRAGVDVAASGVYDADTEKAVRAFQSGHGLPADGQAGPATVAALAMDLEDRYRRIAANMERWRWLPHALPPDRIMVNVAAARLVLFDDGQPALELRAIVGKPRLPTPVLMATITSLLFNPPWDIPKSIAAKEIWPSAERDPDYLRREGIIFVRDGERLRQLPGPRNALGRMKFEMPNPQDVYLHDTPNKELFRRARRFFSHGCIRVENPEAVAQQLLRRDAAWTMTVIDGAIAAEATHRVAVHPAIPVLVLYFTAVAKPDGRIEFLDDVYHRDQPLIDALFPQVPKSLEARESDRRPGRLAPAVVAAGMK
jgi:murein L,D-transpeptidase YcbB/YkuD